MRPSDVLAFWFGDPPSAQPRGEWFRKDAAFDAQVQQRFGAALELALAGGLRQWDAEPAGALARIVMLDQFTRNAFRGTPRAFAGDPLALAAARELVRGGGDRLLSPLQRWFAYLPFEHAEDLAAQAQSIALFTALAAEHPATEEARIWAVKHREVVQRFGRYPHRNAVLGRASTAQEEAFLREPGSSF